MRIKSDRKREPDAASQRSYIIDLAEPIDSSPWHREEYDRFRVLRGSAGASIYVLDFDMIGAMKRFLNLAGGLHAMVQAHF